MPGLLFICNLYNKQAPWRLGAFTSKARHKERKEQRKLVYHLCKKISDWPDRTPSSRSQWSPLDFNQDRGRGGEDNSDEI